MFNNEIQSIFDLESISQFNTYYSLYVYPYQFLYQGKPKWRSINYTTINGVKSRSLSLLNALPVISRRLTKLCLSENITSTNKVLNEVMFTDNFNKRLRNLFEQVFATGYGVIKTYLDGDKDEYGNVIGNYKLKFQFYSADKFIPLSWNSETITEAVFIDKFTKNGKFYTKLEYHSLINGDYQIRQELYKSNNINILGYLTPLEEVFGDTLSPLIFIKDYNSDVPLFTVVNNPNSNNVDSSLPISPSIFVDSEDTLKNLDLIYDSFAREYILGKKRIIVPTQAIKGIPDPKSGQIVRYFDANDEIYQAMNFDNVENLKIQDNSIGIRVDEHIKGLNFFLRTLAVQIGISPNTLSFEPETGIRTATEVRVGQQATAQFVNTVHEDLKSSLNSLVSSVLNLLYAYDIVDTKEMDYNIIIPDSIISDIDETKEVIKEVE